MSLPELYVRLYGIDDDGRYFDMSEEYALSDLNGIVPVKGDFIVDPGVLQGLDRRRFENRTVFEVVHRYFQPASGDDDKWRYLVLVCRKRPGQEHEIDIATKR